MIGCRRRQSRHEFAEFSLWVQMEYIEPLVVNNVNVATASSSARRCTGDFCEFSFTCADGREDEGDHGWLFSREKVRRGRGGERQQQPLDRSTCETSQLHVTVGQLLETGKCRTWITHSKGKVKYAWRKASPEDGCPGRS